MTSPGASKERFWVTKAVIASRGGQPPFIIKESPTSPPDEVAGPFDTRAEAQKWIDAQSLHAPDIDISLPNPFSWVGAISHWIGDAVLHLTDVSMWISIGWILLGAVLMFWGILLWLKIPQRAAGAAAKAAAAAA